MSYKPNEVVYLFGAGASYNAIPVVKGMAVRLKSFLDYFRLHKNPANLGLTYPDSPLEEKWKLLIGEVNESFSIDTLARRAYLSMNQSKLDDIKQLIGAYILWEQIVKPDNNGWVDYINKDPNSGFNFSYKDSTNRFTYDWSGDPLANSDELKRTEMVLRNYDFRYESLFSVIAEERFQLSKRYSFISWNYDNQVEIAINRIFNLEEADIEDADTNVDMKNGRLEGILKDRFIKLNGSSSPSKFDWEPVSRFSSSEKKKCLDRIHKLLIGKQDFDNRISFAWEDNSAFDRTRTYKLLENSRILIIIGYSFPEYNRYIDKELISNAVKGFNSKIFIQDTPNNIENVISRLKSIKPLADVEGITDTGQFYVPL